MRRIIDAHVHIAPQHLLGKTDARFPTTVLPFGQKLESDGFISQFMPDYIENSAFETRVLIHAMDRAGIGKAVIMQSPCLSINDDVIDAVKAYPDRLCGAMIIDPGTDSCLEEMRRFSRAGLTVVKFEMSAGLGFSHPNMYPDLKFDSPLFQKIWTLSQDLGVTVTIDPSKIGGHGYQVEELGRMAEKFPDTRIVICHLGYPDADIKARPDRYHRWREMTNLAQFKNVWFDLAAMSALFSEEGYPYPTALSLLREFIDFHGPEKAVWGSDIPGTLTCATYRQMIDAFEKSPLFTESEKDHMFFQNAEKVYFKKRSDIPRSIQTAAE